MRRYLALACCLTACASQPPARLEVLPEHRPAQPPPAPMVQTQAADMREYERIGRAQLEQQLAAGAAHDRAVEEEIRANTARLEERSRQAALAAISARCTPSRAERAAEGKRRAGGVVQWLTRVVPVRAAVRAACTRRDTTGVHVETERDGTGTTVRMRHVGQPDDVACRGLPKGITLDDARYLVNTPDAELVDLSLTGESQYASDNSDCRDADLAAGLELDPKDTAALRRLLAWGQPDAGAP